MSASLFPVVFLLVSELAFCATGLRCNDCTSFISFEECIKQQKFFDCDKGYKCGKSHYKLKGKDIYSLSCTSNLHCIDPDDMCRFNSQMSNCELTCCDEDFCNTAAGSPPVVSVLVVAACVLGTLMMF